jgi:glycosyltransferase involved in cell wall biosynthesis
MVSLHQPFIVAHASHFVGCNAGPHLIHSFGSWSGVGAALAERLRRRGLKAILLATPFSTYNHETRGKLFGLGRNYSLTFRVQFHLELVWIRLTVDPSERRGFRSADLVLPNYENVRALVETEFGPGIRFGKMTYASEQAFLDESAKVTPACRHLAELEPQNAPLIASVSRHDSRKGLDVLLLALAQLKSRGVRFRACLVGGGQLLERHRRLACELSLQGFNQPVRPGMHHFAWMGPQCPCLSSAG